MYEYFLECTRLSEEWKIKIGEMRIETMYISLYGDRSINLKRDTENVSDHIKGTYMFTIIYV